MQDIARRVGVSRPAVSCTLNGVTQSSIQVSESTRQKILKAAQEMGYQPNELARAVVTGKSRTVAIVINHIQYDYTIRRLEGLIDQADKMGYVLKIFQDVRPGQIDHIADQCISHRVCGMITGGFTGSQALIDRLEKAGIPIALFGSEPTSKSVLQVRNDNRQGFDQAVAYLHQLGHQQIGMITGDDRSYETHDRVNAFKQAMAKYQLDISPDNIKYASSWNVEKAHVCADQMLRQPLGTRPTAICCASDLLVMGVLRAARRLNLQIPADLSLVGLGNMYVSEVSDPPMTTIAQDEEAAVRTLFARLVKLSSDPKADRIVLESMHLIIRESTCSPPRKLKKTCNVLKPRKTKKEPSHV